MRKFLILARVQLWALLTSFRIGGSRKKAASGWAALALMAALCLFISGSYSFPLGEQLAAAGCLELLLMMSVMAVIMGLVFTVFAAQGVVFGGRDADLLLSMPVSAFTALLAKLTALYVENLALCAFLVLPAGAAWLWFGGGGGALFVLRLIVGTLFLALLPTLLSLAGGFLLSWLGGRFANRRAVNLLLYGLMAAAVFFLAVRMNMAVAVLAAGAMGAEAEGAFAGWGVPFLLFQRGVCGDWETLAMFCLLSLAPVLAAAWLFARNYQRVLTGLSSHGKRPAYRLGRLKAAGRRKALLRKEADRYFGTPIYLLNTGIGLILLVVAGIAAAVMGGSLRDRLAQAGYEQYEISNFAKPGYESRHNLKYWTLGEYAGFGPGAHSDLGDVRYAYIRDLDAYCLGVEAQGDILSENERIPPRERDVEYLMLGLRLAKGVSRQEFEYRFRLPFGPVQAALERFERSGHAVLRSGRWHLTPEGFLLSNQIIGQCLEALAGEKLRREEAAARHDFRVR